MRRRKPACPAGFLFTSSATPGGMPSVRCAKRVSAPSRTPVPGDRASRSNMAPGSTRRDSPNPNHSRAQVQARKRDPNPSRRASAAMPARFRAAGHECKETENQNCACEKSCQPRHRCTSGAASPLRQANSIPPPRRPLFPPAAHLRHDHRAADAVFLRKPRAALPLGIRPRVDAARIDCDARAFFLRREFSRTVRRGFVIASGWSGRRRHPSAGAENKYQADQGQAV